MNSSALRLSSLFILACCIALPAVHSPARAAARPNFLFIYTDDQRHDALSVVQREQGARGRFPWFTTPHLDRLASEGVRFRNAFVVNSLCAPSRAVNLTGRYNHLNGIASNFRPFPTNNVTFATVLRASGYTTAYIGKWHMDNQRERPGFDHHASYTGHARYVDPVFIVDGKDTPTKGWIDDLSTDYAIDFLKRQKEANKPWAMVLGFKSPHGPFQPPARTLDRFVGQQARRTPNLEVPTAYMGGGRRRAPGPGDTVPVNLDYFRCISAVDDCLGRLIQALEDTHFASNTVVIYTSDNGFYLGEHGLGDKRSAYDESLRVPFLVRFPALGAASRGRVVDEMVLNLDLAQSLLDLAGVDAPKEMQGQSWRPLLTGAAPNWRKSWFYEYFAERQLNSRVPDITAVRTTDAKLIKYVGHDEWTELFDLVSDPYETKNLFSDPAQASLRARMEAELARLMKQVGYRVPEYTDRPAWWGKPGGPDWPGDDAVLQPLRLDYDFAAGQGPRIKDASGCGNEGSASKVSIGEESPGRSAFRFNGDGHIDVPKSKSLDPSRTAWTVEVVAKAAAPDGMLVARGGKSQGYALWLKSGRPMFTVVVDEQPVTVEARQAMRGWATIRGTITTNQQAELRVNGEFAGAMPLNAHIPADPHDLMQIGADLGSPVLEPPVPRFNGWVERVRVWRGERP